MAARKVTTKKAPHKPCDCATKVNEQLKKQGAELDLCFFVYKGKHFGLVVPIIATQRMAGERWRRVKLTALTATYCPFCGKKFPEADSVWVKR